MNRRLVHYWALSFLGAVGCGAPEQRYAAHEPGVVRAAERIRFELDASAVPGAEEAWQGCLELLDVEQTKQCLSAVPGVRIDTGPWATCDEPRESLGRCRVFPHVERGAAQARVELDEGEGRRRAGLRGAGEVSRKATRGRVRK